MSPEETLAHEQVIWRDGYEAGRRELAEEQIHIYDAGYRSGLAAARKAET